MELAFEVFKTLLTAAAGFAGVWWGQRKMESRDAKQAEKEAKQLQQDRVYLASVVTEHLERYINGCLDVAQDDGTSYGQPAGGDGFYKTTTTAPTFDHLKIEVNWHALPPELLSDILLIRSHQEGIERHLENPGFDDPPDYDGFFSARALMYAQLGQQVTEIAQRLQRVGGIPNQNLTKGDWSRDEAFAAVVEREQTHRVAQAERSRAFNATLTPLSP